ncbi:diacylglycerol acyltransferase [Thraustotheca clavata]|uniref:Acyltransferase n=1 Tax=Thraustotheca clavata TaxID=74557 RepID=A0A1V9ZX06_9STRA|nr:diacylglycerol acyltransferase [Thraustotheca clavata]
MVRGVYLTSSAAFVAGLAVGLQYYELHVLQAVLLAFFLAYLPNFLAPYQFSPNGAYWPWFAKLPLWKKMSQMKTKLHFEEPLSKDKQYLIASHPHGPTSYHHGVMISGTSEPPLYDVIPGEQRRHLGASVVFRIPIYREILLWLGVVDAGRKTARGVLKSGKSLVILVGGIQEQMAAEYGQHHVVARPRKGFIKLAIQHGVSIVPAYAFGENDLFKTSSYLLKLRQWISQKIKVALIICHGPTWWNPLKPFPVEINHVYGKPIPTTKEEHPSHEEVDRVHQLYIDELTRIFEKYKAKYATPDAKLHIL